MSREIVIDVARTSLPAKVPAELADVLLTEAVADSILAIKKQDEPIDLFVVQIMETKHKSETNTHKLNQRSRFRLWAQHPDMKKTVEEDTFSCATCHWNVKKTEVHSGFVFFNKCTEERERLVRAERKFIEDKA